MIERRDFLAAAGTLVTGLWSGETALTHAQQPSTGALGRLSLDPLSGGSRAVTAGAVPLLHTPQVHAWNDSGKIASPGRAGDQVKLAFERLGEALVAGASGFNDLVRLNVYAASNDLVRRVREQLEDLIPAGSRPAVTNVVGGLTDAGSLVALDAVAVSSKPAGLVNVNAAWGRSAARQGVLAPGRKLFISGQAEKGASLRECTRATMTSLQQTLEMFQLSAEHVVQIKSFVTPIGGKAEVEDEIARFFKPDRLPPLVYVEWKSTLPIEIELIAAVPEGTFASATSESVEYHTPKWLSSSPIFSRVALVNSPTTIYTGGLYGKPASAEAQVRDIFAQLREITAETHSDLKHLAKATYYVASDETSAKLNAVRPEFYDPQRPPAASKAVVAGVGLADRGITLDMIAAPVK